jgi:hypothetical protein
MQTSELKVDGNAIGGLLREIFALEMTVAESTCNSCGKVDAMGALDVYMNAPGVVVRCKGCSSVLMRIVKADGRYWLDLKGVKTLELRAS